MRASDNVIEKSSPMAKQMFYRLVIDCSGEQPTHAFSLNKALAEELLKLRPRQRSLQMEKCLLNVLEVLPDNPVVKDVDVLKRKDGTTLVHVGELSTGLDDIPISQPFFVLGKVHVEDVVIVAHETVVD